MPKLPDYRSLGQRLTPSPPVSVAQINPVPSKETLFAPAQLAGRSMEQAGDALFKGGEQIRIAFEEEKKRIDTVRAEEAFNEIRNRRLDLTIGEQEGFKNVKGGDAVKQPLLKNWIAKFDDSANAILEKLGNDEQRALFKKRVDMERISMSEDILAHSFNENKVHQARVFESTVETERRFASANWQDVGSVRTSLERIAAAVNAEGERLGLDDKMRANVYAEQASKVHTSVIEQALNTGNYQYAKKWLEENRGQIEPQAANMIVKHVENAEQKELYNGYNSEFLAVKNSGKALRALHSNVLKDEKLDDDRKNILINRIQNQSDRLQHQAQVAENKRMAMLERMERRMLRYVESGMEIPSGEFDKFASAAQGTEFAGSVKAIVAEQRAVSELSRMTPTQMMSRVKEVQESYGKTPTLEQAAHLQKIQRFVANSVKQMRESNLDYAVNREGVEIERLDMTKPDTWVEGLFKRVPVALEQSKRLGVEPNGLFPEEAAQFSRLLRTLAPEQRVQMLNTLRKGFSDDSVFRASMQKLAQDSPVTALAAIDSTRESPIVVGTIFKESYSPKSTSALALRGEEIINPSKQAKSEDGKSRGFPLPKDQDLRLDFNDKTEGVFAGNAGAYDATYQYAKAIYAGLVSDAGDASGEKNSKLWKEAITRATGGISNFHGSGKIQLPHGLSESDFNDKASAAFRSAVKAHGLDQKLIDQFPRLGLQNYKGNQYYVRSGTSYLYDKNNNRVVINVDSEEGYKDKYGRLLRDQIPK